MRYEFVEFYPMSEEERKKYRTKCVGTIHIYLIDYEMDVRGIRVIPLRKGFFFEIPHYRFKDEDGKKGKYPLLRFVNEEKHKAFMNFLQKEVTPVVEAKLKSQSGK